MSRINQLGTLDYPLFVRRAYSSRSRAREQAGFDCGTHAGVRHCRRRQPGVTSLTSQQKTTPHNHIQPTTSRAAARLPRRPRRRGGKAILVADGARVASVTGCYRAQVLWCSWSLAGVVAVIG